MFGFAFRMQPWALLKCCTTYNNSFKCAAPIVNNLTFERDKNLTFQPSYVGHVMSFKIELPETNILLLQKD